MQSTDTAKAKQFFIQVYIVLLTILLPLYTKTGYSELGEAKASLWRVFSLAMLAFILPVIGFGLYEKRTFKPRQIVKVLHVSDYLALIFSCLLLVSFGLSVDKSAGLWGVSGWRIGVFTWMIMLLYYGVLRYHLVPRSYMVYLLFPGPFLVFSLGLLNRFRIYPIQSLAQSGSVQNNSFLSTIGNINWYCGFLILFLAFAAGLFLYRSLSKVQNVLLGIFLVITLMSAFTQGSDGILIPMCAILGILFFAALQEATTFRKFLWLLFLIGLASEADLILFRLFPDRYHYDVDNRCLLFANSHIGLVLLAGAVFLLLLHAIAIERQWKWRVGAVSEAALWVLAVLLILVPLFVLRMQMHSDFLWAQGGQIRNLIRTMTQDNFGNGRGTIWKISARAYEEMTPLQRAFGVGPGAYSSYCYSIPSVRAMIINAFGEHRLTNAHSILFTMVIEYGWAGMLSFLAFLASLSFRLTRIMTGHDFEKRANGERGMQQHRRVFALIGLLLITCYLSYGLLAFDQIMFTPYFLALLGIAVCFAERKGE